MLGQLACLLENRWMGQLPSMTARCDKVSVVGKGFNDVICMYG